MKKLIALAVMASLMFAAPAFAQQAIPGALDAGGRPAQVTGTAPIVAPAGGGVGIGRPVAEDNPLPVTCLSGCSGGGGGGGAITAAAGSFAPAFSSDFGTRVSPDALSLLGLATSIRDAAQAGLAAQSSHGINIGGVEGVTAGGVTITENPLNEGCRAATTAPTSVTDGQKVAALCGTEGKRIVKPYAIKELDVTGSASSTDTAAHTLFAAAGVGLKNYPTALQCTNSSATDSDITLNNSTSWSVTIKAGAGFGFVFPDPLQTAANTALTYTMSVGVTTVKCNAQGYVGP